jgi:hypothetical protein
MLSLSKPSGNCRRKAWNIGQIFGIRGEVVGEVTCARSPKTMLHDSFSKELERCGFNPNKLVVASRDVIDGWIDHKENVPFENHSRENHADLPAHYIYIAWQDVSIELEYRWVYFNIKAHVAFGIISNVTPWQTRFEGTAQGFTMITTSTTSERILRSALRSSTLEALVQFIERHERQSEYLNQVFD